MIDLLLKVFFFVSYTRKMCRRLMNEIRLGLSYCGFVSILFCFNIVVSHMERLQNGF